MRFWDTIYKDDIIEVRKFRLASIIDQPQYKVIRYLDPIKDLETGELLWPMDIKCYEEIPMNIIRDMKLNSILGDL